MYKILIVTITGFILFSPISSLLWADQTEIKNTDQVTTIVVEPSQNASNPSRLDLKSGTELWLEGNSPPTRFYLTATQVMVSSELDSIPLKQDPT